MLDSTAPLLDENSIADWREADERAVISEYSEADNLQVSLIASSGLDGNLRKDWDDLAEDVDAPNPYFTRWFLEPALNCLDPEQDVQLCVIRRAADRRLVGILPLVFDTGYAKLPLKHAAIWQHCHSYNGTPLMRRGYGTAVYRALLDWIDTRPRGARFIRFHHLPFDTAAEAQIAEACRQTGRSYKIQSRHDRAVLSAGHDYDALMKAAMSGKKRKELRRQANRFADLGEAAFAELPADSAALDAFIRLESIGWKNTDPEGFAFARSAPEQRFFKQAMTGGAKRGAVTCLALTLDGAPAALLFCLRSGGTLSAFKTTFDEELSAYSPGFRLIMHATQRMLEQSGIRIFDSCARQDHPVVDRLWPDRLPVVQLNIPTRHSADARLLNLAAFIEGSKNTLLKRFEKPRD